MEEIEDSINFSQAVVDLKALAEALSIASACHFMAPAHAALIWKKWLVTLEIDVPKLKEEGGLK